MHEGTMIGGLHIGGETTPECSRVSPRPEPETNASRSSLKRHGERRHHATDTRLEVSAGVGTQHALVRVSERPAPFSWLRETLDVVLLPGWLGVLVLSVFPPPCARLLAADGLAKGPITATFSIVAVDPATGQCGAAVASKYPAVGKVVPYVRGGVGAFCTQHWHHPPWGEQALDLLQRGTAPVDVLGTLLRDDPDRDQRQLAIIDSHGRTASVNPTGASQAAHFWGAMAGRYYACQGNTLTGRQVIVDMARAYEETDGSLADRLMAALVAGDSAGGDHRGRLAAGIRVAKKATPGYWLELYVDKSDNAVAELAKKYAALKHPAKGD